MQDLQFPAAFHLSEFLLRFEQSGGRPVQRVMADSPALHTPGHFVHDGKNKT